MVLHSALIDRIRKRHMFRLTPQQQEAFWNRNPVFYGENLETQILRDFDIDLEQARWEEGHSLESPHSLLHAIPRYVKEHHPDIVTLVENNLGRSSKVRPYASWAGYVSANYMVRDAIFEMLRNNERAEDGVFDLRKFTHQSFDSVHGVIAYGKLLNSAGYTLKHEEAATFKRAKTENFFSGELHHMTALYSGTGIFELAIAIELGLPMNDKEWWNIDYCTNENAHRIYDMRATASIGEQLCFPRTAKISDRRLRREFAENFFIGSKPHSLILCSNFFTNATDEDAKTGIDLLVRNLPPHSSLAVTFPSDTTHANTQAYSDDPLIKSFAQEFLLLPHDSYHIQSREVARGVVNYIVLSDEICLQDQYARESVRLPRGTRFLFDVSYRRCYDAADRIARTVNADLASDSGMHLLVCHKGTS